MKLIKQLQEGDLMYVLSIDRLGRNYEEIQEPRPDFGSLLTTVLYKKNCACQIEPAKFLRFL